MERRDLVKTLAASMALAALRPAEAAAAWARAASATPRFSARHAALVDAIADTILPRTDTPGATDVGVIAFVDVIVHENYSDEERALFLAGLDALDAMALASGAASFGALVPERRGTLADLIERADDRSAQPYRTWWRLKGLVIHGYFTSERVMKDVLRHEVMPGRFDGNAPFVQPVLAGERRG
jgi:hypothetical protein